MNSIYLYKYHNGLQFTSTANPVAMTIYSRRYNGQEPIVLGVFKYKKMKNEK